MGAKYNQSWFMNDGSGCSNLQATLEVGTWDLKGGVVDRLQLGGWSSISNRNLDMVVDVVTCDPSLMINHDS